MAGRVAQAVVDELEIVEVEEDHGDIGVAASSGVHRNLEPVVEEHAIGQAGERVVERLVGKAVFQLLALGDVADVEKEAANVGVVQKVRAYRFKVSPGAIDVPCAQEGALRV